MLYIIDFNIPFDSMLSKIRFKLSLLTRDNHYIKITPEIILKLLLNQYFLNNIKTTSEELCNSAKKLD